MGFAPEVLARGVAAVGHRLGRAPLPPGIDLLLTDACDLACKYCPRRTHGGTAGQPRQDVVMDTARALRLLSDLATFAPAIRLIGGEPLLHPDFVRDTVEYVRAALLALAAPRPALPAAVGGASLAHTPYSFFASARNSAWKSGWATEISSSTRWRMLLPRRRAMPCSVTTKST